MQDSKQHPTPGLTVVLLTAEPVCSPAIARVSARDLLSSSSHLPVTLLGGVARGILSIDLLVDTQFYSATQQQKSPRVVRPTDIALSRVVQTVGDSSSFRCFHTKLSIAAFLPFTRVFIRCNVPAGKKCQNAEKTQLLL